MRRLLFEPATLTLWSFYLGLFVLLASCGSDNNKTPQDTTPPQIINVSPADNSLNVPLDNSIIIAFNEQIDNATVSGTTFRLTLDGRDVPGIISSAGSTVSLIPSESFSLLATYAVTVTTGIKDTAGNALAADKVWSFTTRDGNWRTVNSINNAMGDAWGPSVAVNRDGTAIAAWAQTGGGFRNIWANRYTPASGWGTAQLIETYDSDATPPQVRIDSNGNSVVVWEQISDGAPSIRANRYVSGSGWGTAQLIETSSSQAFNPRLAMDNSGNAMAVWVQNGNGVNTIWTNRYSPGSGWGTAQVLMSTGGPDFVTVAMDETGNAIAVWNQWAGPGTSYEIWACAYTYGSGWGTPQRIETGDGNAGPPWIAMDSSGNTVVAWHQSDGTRNRIWSNQYRVGSGWGTAQRVDNNSTSNAYYPQVGIDENGDAIVGWYQDDGPQWSTWANVYANGTGWGTPRQLSPDGVMGSLPRVAMDPAGNAIVAWFQFEGSRSNMWANRYGKHSGWSTPQLIETIDGNIASIPDLAVHPKGKIVAVWPQNDGTYDRVWAAWFE